MKLAASNIAWTDDMEPGILDHLRNLGFKGLEVAPTRWIPDRPYLPAGLVRARELAESYREGWGLHIPSLQSIWYGVTQSLFGTEDERQFLQRHTQRATDFAWQVGCSHLVFGSPRNRFLHDESMRGEGVRFFSACAEYARSRGVVIGVEANPTSYGTNYITATSEAIDLVRSVAHPNFRLNLDFGTIIANRESWRLRPDEIELISHVHISEPDLAPIEKRPEHSLLLHQLLSAGYKGWFSVEMKKTDSKILRACLEYVSELLRAVHR